MSEIELASIAKFYFEKKGWDMYPEVCFASFPGRPDWVARKYTTCAVIECKLSLNFSALEQLTRWRHEAYLENFVYSRDAKMGIPNVLWACVQSYGTRSYLKDYILSNFGIGVLRVDKRSSLRTFDGNANLPHFNSRLDVIYWNGFEYSINVDKTPKMQPGSRQTSHRLIDQLCADMKVAISGAKSGDSPIVTPYRRTMNAVYSFLKDGKDHHIDDIVRGIEASGGHHYVSDKNAINGIDAGLRREGVATTGMRYGPWFKLDKGN